MFSNSLTIRPSRSPRSSKNSSLTTGEDASLMVDRRYGFSSRRMRTWEYIPSTQQVPRG
jgi:hypothetical protein